MAGSTSQERLHVDGACSVGFAENALLIERLLRRFFGTADLKQLLATGRVSS
jgi:hypothetical protein